MCWCWNFCSIDSGRQDGRHLVILVVSQRLWIGVRLTFFPCVCLVEGKLYWPRGLSQAPCSVQPSSVHNLLLQDWKLRLAPDFSLSRPTLWRAPEKQGILLSTRPEFQLLPKLLLNSLDFTVTSTKREQTSPGWWEDEVENVECFINNSEKSAIIFSWWGTVLSQAGEKTRSVLSTHIYPGSGLGVGLNVRQ